eukprot:jgi/Undpi1/3958/HiC_scaffold_16.g07326.m1
MERVLREPKTATTTTTTTTTSRRALASTAPGVPPPSKDQEKTDDATVLGVGTVYSSTKDSNTGSVALFQPSFSNSSSRIKKKVKKAARLTLKVGELVVKTHMVEPLMRSAVEEWKNFNGFRSRAKAARRSKTLDWLEARAQTVRQEADAERQRRQDRQRTLQRTHAKQERAYSKLQDFLNEVRHLN